MCVICVRFAAASARHAKFTWDPPCGDWSGGQAGGSAGERAGERAGGQAGGPAAGEHQQSENINGVAGKPPMVMTKRQSFDFRPLLVARGKATTTNCVYRGN